MITAAILLFCLGTGSLGYPTGLIPENLKESVIGFINHGNGAAQQGARQLSQHSTNFTAASIHHSNHFASAASSHLSGWLDHFNQFLDNFSRLFSGIPFIGATIGISNSVLKTEARLLNEVGQNVIQTSNNLTNMNLRALDNILQAELNAFTKKTNYVTDVLSGHVRDSVATLNQGAKNIYDAFEYNDVYEEDGY